ncbi:hypothetical protein F5B21DRAFT_510313 [Xylaria acuta]|nr:hypothetical protein F5B21DRAFT_510313 [Xylaria acuta]
MDQLIQPTTMPPKPLVAAEITLDIVIASFVFARLMWNYHHSQQLFADDYLCVVAVLFISSFSATTSMLNSSTDFGFINAPKEHANGSTAFFRKPTDVSISFITSV